MELRFVIAGVRVGRIRRLEVGGKARKRAVVLLSNSAAGRAPGAIAVETLAGVELPQPKPE